MHLSGYYVWDTHEMVTRRAIHRFKEATPCHADMNNNVVHGVTVSTEAAPDNAGTAVRVSELNVAHYRHSNLLLSFNQIEDPEISLCGISDTYVLSLENSFHSYGLN